MTQPDTPTFRVSGFADEIDDDLARQLDVLESEGLGYLDLRNVWGENSLDLSDDRLDDLQSTLAERGIGVTSIGSPIGKIGIEDPFEPHFERFERALELADRFDADRVRVFSYYIPEGDDPAEYREEVLSRTRAIVDRAEETDVTLVLENERGLYGDTPGRVRDLLTTVDSPQFRTVFDPANYLEVGVRPYPDALLQVVEYVDQVHVKDGQFDERGAVEPAGHGDGRIPETLEALRARGFSGILSLEPHLTGSDSDYDYTGPEGYRAAVSALRDILDEMDASYE